MRSAITVRGVTVGVSSPFFEVALMLPAAFKTQLEDAPSLHESRPAMSKRDRRRLVGQPGRARIRISPSTDVQVCPAEAGAFWG